MKPLEEAIYRVIGIWIFIILFVTFPLWWMPYVIYHTIKSKKE